MHHFLHCPAPCPLDLIKFHLALTAKSLEPGLGTYWPSGVLRFCGFAGERLSSLFLRHHTSPRWPGCVFGSNLLSIGFEEAVINSCAFGSIHKKPFRLLGHGLPMESLNVPCPGGHEHVKVEANTRKRALSTTQP